ncbi:hypothetical protein KI387_007833, partial [Taxus chinensis]
MAAHIGRRQYTIALLSQFHQFQMAEDITTCSDQNKDGFAQEKLDDTDTSLKVIPNTNLCDLPFVEYDGIIAISVESNKFNQFEAKNTSEGEPLLKCMRITSENEGVATHNVRGHSGSEESCMQMLNQLDEITMHRSDFTSSKADIYKSSNKQGFGVQDKVEETNLGRKSNEVEVVQEITRCSKCGSSFTEICKYPFTSEGSFMHMEAQLLALHSAESLSSDLRSLSSTSTYPICGSVHVSAIKVASEKACVGQQNSVCGSRQQFSHFSINVLRLAHSALASDWKKWLVDSKLNIKEQLIDEVFICIELFLKKRQAIFHAQAMMWKAMAAQTQSNLDSRAFLEHQLYISA